MTPEIATSSSYFDQKGIYLTVLLLLGLIYYSVRVHTSGFGSYKQLLPVLALTVIVANLIVVLGILLAMGTGKDNIFSAPDTPVERTARPGGHVAGHLIVMVVGPLILWGIGSLIMLLTKKLTGGRQPRTGTAGA